MATSGNKLEPLLSEREIARITGLSLATIRRRRLLKLPPRYLKISSAVRYRRADVAAWLEACPTAGGPLREHDQPEGRGVDIAQGRVPSPVAKGGELICRATIGKPRNLRN